MYKMGIDLVSGLLLLVVVLLVLWLMTRRPKGFPPGPPRLPVIGNLLNMSSDFRVLSSQMRRRYGDIFSVYVFNKPIIFITGYDVIREALVKNADVFSNRPHSFVSQYLTGFKGIVSSSGDAWREQRRFALTTLRDLGMGKSVLEDKILEEMVEFLNAFEEKKGLEFNCGPVVHNAVSNIICSVVFGKRFEYTDKLFKDFLEAQSTVIGGAQLADTFNEVPLSHLLPGDIFKFKKMIRSSRFVEYNLIKPSIKEHMLDEDEVNRDLISGYIKEMKKRLKEETSTYMGYDHLEKVIFDLFLAGSETTTTAIRWALVYFLNYPDVQEKCFQEVKDTIGLERPPSMKDKTSLPYVEATIMEVLRHGEIAPSTIPYTVTEDTHFKGFVLPRGVTIIPMLHSVLKDEDIWGDPEIFRPERFINEEGKVSKSDKFIPFSLGRRVCLGESLARMELFLFITSMVQRFQFVIVDGVKPSMEGIIGATHSPKPFKLKAVLRS